MSGQARVIAHGRPVVLDETPGSRSPTGANGFRNSARPRSLHESNRVIVLSDELIDDANAAKPPCFGSRGSGPVGFTTRRRQPECAPLFSAGSCGLAS